MSPAADRTTRESLWKLHDPVWVLSLGKWRPGVVVHPLPSGARVDYECRRDGARRTGTFRDKEATILKGSLPPPIVTSCPECKRKIVDGRPGEDEESVIARHYGRSHAPTPSTVEASSEETGDVSADITGVGEVGGRAVSPSGTARSTTTTEEVRGER